LLTVIAPVWHVVATLIPHLITCRLGVVFGGATGFGLVSFDLGSGGCGQQAEQGCRRACQCAVQQSLTHCLFPMPCRTWSRKCANAKHQQHRCSHPLARGWRRVAVRL
jgi:hypothetical protein